MKLNSARKKRKEYIWGQLSLALCGLFVTIKKSNSKDQEGLAGFILEETSNLLRIKIENKLVWVQKKHSIFEIELSDKSCIIINGDLLVGKPEERVKKRFYSW